MATAQRPKHPTQRMSSGRDILSRMLQMEKQSKHQRTSSISPTLPISPKLDLTNGSISSPARSPNLPSPAPHSSPRPTNISRSQTAPNLDTTVPSAEIPQSNTKLMPLTVSTDIAPEDRLSEICLSPSWSDHGEKARKKERRRAEKEEKEREKRLRQDEERQKAIDLKAGKRLSKKQPPAAMETQKMPTSLRRNSWKSFISTQTSSGENSRRSSRDEKRLSGVSFGSTRSKRSQSTPGTSTDSARDTVGALEPWKPIVSPSAPKLPSFRFSSPRKVFSDQAKPASAEKEDAYDKDLIAFAYRLETSSIMNEPETIDIRKLDPISAPEMPLKPTAAAPIQKTTEPVFKSVPYESVSKESPQPTPIGRNGKPEIKVADGQAKSKSGQSSPGLAANGSLPSPGIKAHSPTKSKSGQSSPGLAGNGSLPSPGIKAHSPIKAPRDGSSYVHKQRMYQQQQSIAGFEDQLAIKDATEAAMRLATENEALARAPKLVPEPLKIAQPAKAVPTHSKNASVTSVYTKQRDRSSTPPSPRPETVSAKQQPLESTPLTQSTKPLPETPEEKHKIALQNAEKSMSLTNGQPLANHKTDKILGFRRRTKQSPALISIPYGAENQVVAVQSASLDITPNEGQGEKRSKIERLFKEPKPAFANRDRRSSSSSSQDRIKDTSPEAKPQQNHSRTRTASSTAVTNDMISPLPKSKTESTMNKSKKPDERASPPKSDHGDRKRSKTPSKNGPQTSDSKPSSPVADMVPKSRPTLEAKPSPKLPSSGKSTPNDEDLTKPGKKQAHEVILASETGEGIIRKTSIKRPRSNPQIQKPSAPTESQALDFLPPLKHQPLVKRDRHSPSRSTPVSISQFQDPTPPPLAYSSPSPTTTNPPDLKLIPRSPLRPPSAFPLPTTRINRSATEVSNPGAALTSIGGLESKPLAKLFVICCKCKFWHDLPSKLYEAMALPLELHRADEKGKGKGNGVVTGARLETAVKCPWCEHAMTTGCCQGWTTVVYLHERHH